MSAAGGKDDDASANTLPLGDAAFQSTIPPPRAGELTTGARVGRYVVLRTLGRGGMGVVYMAFDQELDRRIALKLLVEEEQAHGGSDATEGKARLLREAQAMAKLSHPNVVAIYDVGTFGAQVFLAMEYVDGRTLRAWRDSNPRTPREIVATYLQAARGLEAAHAAGIFHRDFKPENVIVDGAGRVRVLDFGLARIEPSAERLDELALLALTTSSSSGAMLTRVGTVLGTPAYMAPEQLAGARVDARSDQFSFAVALYEALYGERPFEGKVLRELIDAIQAERVRPPRSGTRVPRGVRAALLRGLRADAENRFPTLTEMIAALERATVARRRNAIVAAAALCVGLVATAVAVRPARAPVCAGAATEIAGTWGSAQKGAIAAAFLATGNPRAADTWRRIEPAIDAYARGWTAMRTESCEATRVRGVQSDEALDLRTACLDQRRRELGATAAVLATANAKLVDDAVNAVHALPDLSQCADVPSLRAPYAEPHDPAQKRAVDAIRKQLAEGTVLVSARKIEEAARILSPAAAEAERLGNRPLEAAARLLIGRTEVSRGRSKDALVTLRAAAHEANAARDDATEAGAWTLLVRVAGFDLARFDESQLYAELADAAVQRAGGSEALRSNLLLFRGYAHYARTELDETLRLYREALALREHAFGKGSTEAAEVQIDLADVESDLDHLRSARALYESALATRSAVFGEDNPVLGLDLMNLSMLLASQGDAAEAVRTAERALRVIRPDDDRHPTAQMALAQALVSSGETARGMEVARDAFRELGASHEPGSWVFGAVRANLAEVTSKRHLTQEALDQAGQAIPILAKTENYPDSLRAARQIRALCLARLGRSREALSQAESELAAEEKESGPTSYRLLEPLLAVGESALGTRDAARALGALERASGIAEGAEGGPEVHADVHLALARALLATRGDLARARSLAERAAREYDETRLPALALEARTVASSAQR